MRNFFAKPTVALPLGMLISNIGNGMYVLAVGKLLYDSTGKTSSFALIIIIEAVLSFVTQSFASIITDKGYAQKAGAIAEFIRGVVIIVCGIGAFLGGLYFLIIAATLVSLFRPFYRTSIFAIGPLIAKKTALAKYNAHTATFQQIGQFIGAGLTGGIIVLWSPYVAIFFNGVSYLLSAYFMESVKIHEQKHSSVFNFFKLLAKINLKHMWLEWFEMVKHLLIEKHIFFLALLGTTDVVIASFVNITYAPLLQSLNVSGLWLSVWDSLFAVGAILGANAFGHLKRFHNNITLSMLGLTVEGLLFVFLPFMNAFTMAPLMFLLGVFNSISISSFSLSLQTNAQQKFMGRLSGVRQMCISLATVTIIPILSHGMNSSVFFGSEMMAIVIAVVILATFITLPRLIFAKNRKG